MVVASQASDTAPVVTQQPLAAQTTQPLPFFPRMQENAVWAWTATVEKLETVGQKLKWLFLKVVEAIREFFAPKVESVEDAAAGLCDTTKPAPVPVKKAPEVVGAPVVPKVDAKTFVPLPIKPGAQSAVEPPVQVQMPVTDSIAGGVPAKGGIFSFRRWFWGE